MKSERRIPDTIAVEELDSTLAVGERARTAALGHLVALSQAATRRAQRESLLLEARLGKDAAETKQAAARIEHQRAVKIQAVAEMERYQVEFPTVEPDRAAVVGRVVTVTDGLGLPGLTVAAVDVDGSIRARDCTDELGGFTLDLKAGPEAENGDDEDAGPSFFLEVSDPDGKVLTRGSEQLRPRGGLLVYRELGLTEDLEAPCPPPPPRPRRATVPDVVGVEESGARETILDRGLTIGVRRTRPVAERVGLVLEQDPAARRRVAAGTPVSLVVGIAEPIAVPDLVGLTTKEARVRLAVARLEVGTLTRRPAERVGTVLHQDPRAGATTTAGSAVNLIVGQRGRDRAAELAKRLEAHALFGDMKVEAGRLAERFRKMGADSPAGLKRMAAQPDPELRAATKLRSRKNLEAFRRIVEETF